MEESKIKLYKNGDLYKGRIQQQGEACYRIVDTENNSETIINGVFSQNKMRGYMIFNQASKYEKYLGEIEILKNKFVMKDFGVLFYKDGKIFTGDIQQQSSIGQLKNNKYTYFGQLTDGKRNGFGRFQMENFTYVGDFTDGKKNGYFEVFNNDKLYLQGLFQNDVLQKGILYPLDHDSIVSIEANQFEKNFQPVGLANINLKNYNTVVCDIGSIYQNNVLDTEKEVKGFIMIKDEWNSFYTGYFKNFQMHGLGVLRRLGVIKYEGNFQNGKINGLGKMFQGEHKILIGNFQNGIMEGFGVQICLDRVIQGTYKNGRIHNEEEIELQNIDLKQFEQK